MSGRQILAAQAAQQVRGRQILAAQAAQQARSRQILAAQAAQQVHKEKQPMQSTEQRVRGEPCAILLLSGHPHIFAMRRILPLALLLWAGIASAQGAKPSPVELPRSASSKGAAVYLIAPRDGEIVGQTFTAVFGLRGMGVAPAGTKYQNTGHHHLLIDLKSLPDLNRPLPTTQQVRHYGGGQTEAVLTLPPGRHTLQLLLGDRLHIPHQPPLLSEKISIVVQ